MNSSDPQKDRAVDSKKRSRSFSVDFSFSLVTAILVNCGAIFPKYSVKTVAIFVKIQCPGMLSIYYLLGLQWTVFECDVFCGAISLRVEREREQTL